MLAYLPLVSSEMCSFVSSDFCSLQIWPCILKQHHISKVSNVFFSVFMYVHVRSLTFLCCVLWVLRSYGPAGWCDDSFLQFNIHAGEYWILMTRMPFIIKLLELFTVLSFLLLLLLQQLILMPTSNKIKMWMPNMPFICRQN